MKKSLHLAWVLLCLLAYASQAQYTRPENKIWAMDKNTGLDFRGSNPVLINTNLRSHFSLAHEACAALANANGFVFYTNGTTVWDSTGSIMPHGLRINGPGNNSESATQGALIMPYLSQDAKYTKYYLFSLNSIDLPGKLFCNLVNMDLNAGLGDVDTTFSLYHVAIDSALSEKMIAVPGCNGSIWLLVHAKLSPVFKAYEVNAAGINLTPVISTCGANMNASIFPGIGVMKSSPDGTRLMASYPAGLEVYHFDKYTGIVSNAQLLDSTVFGSFGFYGGEFSPDGTKVYAKEYGGNGTLWQYDLSAANPPASKTVIGASFPALSDIKLAPDQKLYFLSKTGYPTARYMGRINTPDNAGTACGFQDSIVSLAFDTAHVVKGNFGGVVMYPVFNLPLAITFNNNVLSTTNTFSTYQWYKAGQAIAGATGQTCTATGSGWYSVKVTNANGCPDSAAYQVTGGGTGIATPDMLADNIHIYPNPARDKVYIQAAATIHSSFSDIAGKKLLENRTGTEIDIRLIPEGLYFLRISDRNGHLLKVEKLLIRH